MPETPDVLMCSFCLRGKHEVAHLVVGPTYAAICEGCLAEAAQAIRPRGPDADTVLRAALASLDEIAASHIRVRLALSELVTPEGGQ